MQRVLIVLAVAVVLVCSFFLFRVSQQRPSKTASEQAPATEKVRIVMKWFFAPTMSPYFAGKEKGIFKRYGIDVDLQQGGPANPSVKAVLTHNAEFGITGAEDIIRQRSQDIPIKSLAVIFRNSPVCFVTLKSSGITSPEQFKGKRILISYGENAEYEFRALVAKVGLGPKDFQEERFAFTYTEMLNGKADVAPAYAMDQALSLQREGHQINVIRSRDFGINPYGDVLFTTEQMINDKPDTVARVVAAMIACWEEARKDMEGTAKLFVQALPGQNFEPDVAKASLEASMFLVQDTPEVGIGMQEAKRWQDTWDIVTTHAQLQKKPPVEDCYLNRFVEMSKYVTNQH